MSRASKRDTKPEEKVEVKAVTADTAQVEVTADEAPVAPQSTETPTTTEADVQAGAATDDDAAQPGLPDHLAHRVSLEEYSRLRGLNAFGQAHLTRAVGAYDRPFEEWEAARQNVIGG